MFQSGLSPSGGGQAWPPRAGRPFLRRRRSVQGLRRRLSGGDGLRTPGPRGERAFLGYVRRARAHRRGSGQRPTEPNPPGGSVETVHGGDRQSLAASGRGLFRWGQNECSARPSVLSVGYDGSPLSSGCAVGSDTTGRGERFTGAVCIAATSAPRRWPYSLRVRRCGALWPPDVLSGLQSTPSGRGVS